MEQHPIDAFPDLNDYFKEPKYNPELHAIDLFFSFLMTGEVATIDLDDRIHFKRYFKINQWIPYSVHSKESEEEHKQEYDQRVQTDYNIFFGPKNKDHHENVLDFKAILVYRRGLFSAEFVKEALANEKSLSHKYIKNYFDLFPKIKKPNENEEAADEFYGLEDFLINDELMKRFHYFVIKEIGKIK